MLPAPWRAAGRDDRDVWLWLLSGLAAVAAGGDDSREPLTSGGLGQFDAGGGVLGARWLATNNASTA